MMVHTSTISFPRFLPSAVHRLTEVASIALAQHIQQVDLLTDLSDRPITTTYVRQGQGHPPLLLLHGFDSSVLEFRRLLPLLANFRETWAVDLLGFGFTDRSQTPVITPAAIQHHLHRFWQQQIQQPVVLIGASMGGAVALQMALTQPALVKRLVLLDSAGLAAGPALERLMVPPLDRWATAFLRNPAVRRRISRRAYYDKRWVTPDAEECASLHLDCPRWSEALIAFTQSGGYRNLGDRLAEITVPTLILWGRHDRILGTRDAQAFQRALPQAQLTWLEQCGHVPHLEKPQETAAAIRAWVGAEPIP